ncbi:dystrophia myotonica WD repeat-containing protein isoform X1 [Corvus hawaiiensis]|uniref:dystrophia myotonica WD repeat-containing protein isoform X1 n=1 Tax=Corvus hawaiiensis TaxID=134902 RepID=UPI002018745D|nr:dystrophia myotonica WD repeat-containing protein isoform X1 [Corvus hawaiiensis]
MAAAAAAPGPGPAEAPAAAPELKSRFRTREGSYRLLGPATAAAAAASAASSAGPAPAGPAPPGPGALPPVRLSMVRLARSRSPPGGAAERSRVCCNLGRELHFYGGAGAGGRGSRRALDLQRPIDKRVYKGTQPTCHDFNQFTAGAETLALLVGFSAGQVQYLDLAKKDSAGRLFNEERLIDKSKVTLVKWLPDTERLFLASHASGHLYLYDSEQPCGATSPQYTLLTQGEGFRVFSCKSKTPRNPLLKWAVGSGPLNEFAFSPDGRSLACVSQDGVLRVFHFSSMLLQGMMRSYFGGLLCVCWSPDGRYVVTGGEDDLVTVWSFAEGRVVARGHGHKSWVNAVAFDPFTTTPPPPDHAGDDHGDAPEDAPAPPSVTYRFGSAGQDTQFCLWDLTEDVLDPRPPPPPPPPPPRRVTTEPASMPGLPRSLSRSNSLPQPGGGPQMSPRVPPALSAGRFATLTLRDPPEKEHKRYHSLGNISRGGGGSEKPPGGGPGGSRGSLDMGKVLGTALCPRLHEVPLLEPLVCKKIAQERLTVLLFLEDCIVTGCQEGLICTWARPGVSAARRGSSAPGRGPGSP